MISFCLNFAISHQEEPSHSVNTLLRNLLRQISAFIVLKLYFPQTLKRKDSSAKFFPLYNKDHLSPLPNMLLISIWDLIRTAFLLIFYTWFVKKSPPKWKFFLKFSSFHPYQVVTRINLNSPFTAILTFSSFPVKILLATITNPWHCYLMGTAKKPQIKQEVIRSLLQVKLWRIRCFYCQYLFVLYHSSFT